MLTRRQRAVAQKLVAAEGEAFATLVDISGLDPARAFRGADLAGVDFGASVLDGYDFTNADLTGASFAHASVRGAIFTNALMVDVLWPRPRTEIYSQIELTSMQHHAVQRMLEDIKSRKRSLVLMPTGTGRSVVLEEVISSAMDRRVTYGALLVNTIAERDQLAHRLRARLGPELIWTAKRGAEIRARPGLLIQASTYRDLNPGQWSSAAESYSQFEVLFTNSVEKVQQLMRGGGGEALRDTVIATVDSSPIDADRPDRRQFAARVRRLFGGVSYVFEIEEAVSAGLLIPSEIVTFEDASENAELIRQPISEYAPPTVMRDFAHQLRHVFEGIAESSLLVLCRNDDHAGALTYFLEEDKTTGHGVPITRLGTRWGQRRLPEVLADLEGLVIAPVSRQTMELARNHPHVAVLAPLSVARAQDLAFRPPSDVRDIRPRLYDMVDAFSGFPNRTFNSSW